MTGPPKKDRDACPAMFPWAAEMTKRNRRRRPGALLHFLNADGMVACNPRDREAAHRADVEGIATDDPRAVTCEKCLAIVRSEERARRQ